MSRDSKAQERPAWQVWADTGGTFTDCLGVDPAGQVHRAKVLSSSALRGSVESVENDSSGLGCWLTMQERWPIPDGFCSGATLRCLGEGGSQVLGRIGSRSRESLGRLHLQTQPSNRLETGTAVEIAFDEEAPVLAARWITRTRAQQPLPPLQLRLATTRGTNALLERRGAEVAFFVTRGFADLLHIGDQSRPELFALDIVRPRPLPEIVVEVDERLAADGSVLQPLNIPDLLPRIQELQRAGVRSAAVCLLHSYREPKHEEQLARVLREHDFQQIAVSSRLAPLIKLLPRAETAVVEAYLAGIVGRYLERVEVATSGGSLHVMTSAGGLVQASAFRAVDSLLSGPAGGVVGAADAAREAGLARVVAFDMGGTSTDVSRWDGDFEYLFEHRVGDARLAAPALAIETVAAGGGSVCSVEGEQLKVGPESAGAVPGPACYGAGGPLTLTDVNLLLGRLVPARLGFPMVAEPAEQKLRAISSALPEQVARESLLEGFLAIANERMAEAVRQISVRRGYDPKDYALVAFGGAGGQHACAVAELLGIDRILLPEDAGLLSARGLGAACIERFAHQQVLLPLEQIWSELEERLARLAADAIAAVAAEGVLPEEVQVRRRIALLRLQGQESTIEVDARSAQHLASDFAQAYEEIYGYPPPERPVEVESLRVVASSATEALGPVSDSGKEGETQTQGVTQTKPAKRQRACFGGHWQSVRVVERYQLSAGETLRGPALVTEDHATLVLTPGWQAERLAGGGLLLQQVQVAQGAEAPLPTAGALSPHRPSRSAAARAVALELFTHRFESIAAEMGEALQRTALSTNIKDRLDYSCALLDPQGRLVVNAPHIPVHLGALGLCVRRVREHLEMGPGDAVVTNHPAFGGSHLPDVTVLTAAYADDGSLLGYVANRAHHAEIGGTRPGSMPPDARSLAEEGVVLAPTYLARGGQAQTETLRSLLTGATHPSRTVEENLADLSAQMAANHRGVLALQQLAKQHGADTVRHYMALLDQQAALRLRGALERLGERRLEAVQTLDDGTPLQVVMEIGGGQVRIDFSGTGKQHPGNLNAPPAVARSAVLYVLRLLLDEDLPLNEGLMRPVLLTLPAGCFLNPDFDSDPRLAPAVVGGNVETSQRIVDTLLQALGLAACSQGTMNNVLFGNRHFGYYETVCGGSGAGLGFAGSAAVHTHMTNTRITDPELLESRFPVRLQRFAVRRGSGGAGRYAGGDGAVRELEFTEEVSLSLLSQHRRTGPYGAAGGESGQPGRQVLIRGDGRVEELDGIAEAELQPGDRLCLETPGGGGWGRPVVSDEVADAATPSADIDGPEPRAAEPQSQVSHEPQGGSKQQDRKERHAGHRPQAERKMP